MITTSRALAKDDEFLYKLYSSTRVEEISNWGWGVKEQEIFLQMQYHAQRNHYATQYPNPDHQIIYYEDSPIGRIYLSRDKKSITLVDISIIPNYQKQGIGTQLIQKLQDEAAQSTKNIILHVYIHNQAQSLYSRLGFTCKGVNDVYMEWNGRF